MNKLSPTEQQLSMTRQKDKSLAVSISYKLVKVGKNIFGRERLLKFFLNSSRINWRFAFELAGELYGGDFHLYSKALNEEFLCKYIDEKSSVIDIGCGVGRWCKVASKYAKNVVGIDYDASLISIANRENKAENIEFIVGDVTKDLQNRKFDLALLTHVIEHIETPDILLNELKNIADKIIVEVPDFAQDPLNFMRLKHNLPFYSDGDHVREYTLEILKNQVERTGWKIIDEYKNGGAVLVVAEKN
jgi:2-polyprenyl-3-methyl-5-hydroxy-6-metoxy-1,4-benzoquinol methylase